MPPTSEIPELPELPEADALIVEHLPLARSLALRYRDRGEPVDDLVQVAYLGLVKAGRRFRRDRGHSFAAYAAPTITGELRRHFRDHGWDVRPPRRLQELQAKVRGAENELTQRLGRPPTAAELAADLGVAEPEIEAAATASRCYTAVPLDDLDNRAPGSMQDPSHEFDEVLATMTLQPLLADLPERDQRIIGLRYFGGATQEEIGREIGVTQMQVSRLLTQAVRRMRLAAGIAA